jgi:4-azaleucine resistance transporter AzlC
VRKPSKVISDALILGASVGIIGVSFGVVAVAAGLSPLKAQAMSVLVFTGASQFAAVGIIASGGSPFAAVLSGLLLGARNAAYGLYLAPLMRGGAARRALQSHLVLDESTGLASIQPDDDTARRGFLAAGLSVFTFWNLGTLVGALAGSVIGDPLTLGLDVALPSAFLALLGPRLTKRDGRTVAMLGAVIATALIPLAPAGIPVVAASSAAVIGAFFIEPDRS